MLKIQRHDFEYKDCIINFDSVINNLKEIKTEIYKLKNELVKDGFRFEQDKGLINYNNGLEKHRQNYNKSKTKESEDSYKYQLKLTSELYCNVAPKIQEIKDIISEIDSANIYYNFQKVVI